MQLTATEVSDLIKKRIESFDVGVEARSEGTIVTLTDGIARIHLFNFLSHINEPIGLHH